MKFIWRAFSYFIPIWSLIYLIQLLNRIQYIEGGYEKSLTTATLFVDLSDAYDTVNHRLILTKLYGLPMDAEFT